VLLSDRKFIYLFIKDLVLDRISEDKYSRYI